MIVAIVPIDLLIILNALRALIKALIKYLKRRIKSLLHAELKGKQLIRLICGLEILKLQKIDI